MKSTSQLLTSQKTLTILMIFLTVIESLGRVASSLTLAPLTDQLISKNLHGVVFWLLSTIGIWGVTLTVNYGNSLLKAQIIRKVTNQLRVDIANGLNTVPISEYKKVNHNEYVSWLTNDVNMIDQNGLGPSPSRSRVSTPYPKRSVRARRPVCFGPGSLVFHRHRGFEGDSRLLTGLARGGHTGDLDRKSVV